MSSDFGPARLIALRNTKQVYDIDFLPPEICNCIFKGLEGKVVYGIKCYNSHVDSKY